MKNVRIFYTKTGRMKFVSHLDMNRLMSRVMRKSGLPVWYTEGFNQHIYINYAVPLSLGFEGTYEVMDFRLIDDNFPLEKVIESLSAVAPVGIEFFKVTEPKLPTVDITYAQYEIEFDTDLDLTSSLDVFFKNEEIICSKKDKKGRIKEFDIIPRIKKSEFKNKKLNLILTAGNEANLNPTLVLNKFFEISNLSPIFYQVKRTALFDSNMNLFE